jgi:hypothetical protein
LVCTEKENKPNNRAVIIAYLWRVYLVSYHSIILSIKKYLFNPTQGKDSLMLQKLLFIIVLALPSFFCVGYAKSTSETEFHDVDPRNTQLGIGIGAESDGDLKITTNGGFSNLYGNGEYKTQLVFMAEYRTQSEQARLRGANFDERFGGIYLDLSLQSIMNMYTVGYMLPLQAINSKVLFFPSINYTYVDFDTKAAANEIIDINGGPITLDGVDYGRDAIASIIKKLGLKGHDTSSLGSFNLYSLMPWNETHFTLIQATAGSSYSGFDMEMVDVFLEQGMRTKLGKQVVIVFFEAEYTKVNIQGVEISDTSIGLGINLKF